MNWIIFLKCFLNEECRSGDGFSGNPTLFERCLVVFTTILDWFTEIKFTLAPSTVFFSLAVLYIVEKPMVSENPKASLGI